MGFKRTCHDKQVMVLQGGKSVNRLKSDRKAAASDYDVAIGARSYAFIPLCSECLSRPRANRVASASQPDARNDDEGV